MRVITMTRFHQIFSDIIADESYFYSDFEVIFGKQHGPDPDPIEVHCKFQELAKLCKDLESKGFIGVIELDPRRLLFGVRFVIHVGTVAEPLDLTANPDEIVKVFCHLRDIHVIVQHLRHQHPSITKEFNTLLDSEGQPFLSSLALRWQ